MTDQSARNYPKLANNNAERANMKDGVSLLATANRQYYDGFTDTLQRHNGDWTYFSTNRNEPMGLSRWNVGHVDPEAEIHGSMPQDLVLVTEDGPEILTHHLSHDLFIAE